MWLIYILLALFLLYIFLVLDLNIISVSKYVIKNKKIPQSFDGYKIVQISDLHNKKFGKNNDKLMRKIDKINPDIIVMTGDIVDRYSGRYNFSIAEELVSRLCKKYMVYYSLGNHETSLNYCKLLELKNKIKNAGAVLLDNRRCSVKVGNESINIYGLNFKNNMLPNKNKNFVRIIENCIGKLDKSKFNILLAHDALNYDIYDKYGADLIFSGHVHGGIIRLFGIGMLSPRRNFFPKYSGGKYTKAKSTMIVSRGLGNSRLGIRVFNFPDLVYVQLKK